MLHGSSGGGGGGGAGLEAAATLFCNSCVKRLSDGSSTTHGSVAVALTKSTWPAAAAAAVAVDAPAAAAGGGMLPLSVLGGAAEWVLILLFDGVSELLPVLLLRAVLGDTTNPLLASKAGLDLRAVSCCCRCTCTNGTDKGR